MAARRTTARRVPIDPQARRDALIAAAERVFVQHGYHAATMDQIAAAAGISKRTLYQLVSSKEQLFTDLLARRQQAFDFQVETENRPIGDVLFDLLIGWAGYILSAKAVALTRLIMVDYLHDKTLSRLLNRESAKPCRDALIAYLAECHANGLLTIHDPDEIANMLYGMTIGNIHVKILLGLGKAPSKADLRRRVQAAVALLLRGTAPAYSPDNSRRR
jgi:TetR/AcrR family transcriptional regulator of autoinduction and epiphytic fitness